MLKDKYKVEKLPITREFRKEKRLIEDRGELALIADGDEIRHITYFSLNPGPNFFRGGHYHKIKVETFYIISGKLWVSLKNVTTNEEDKIKLESGNKIIIYPFCAHKFEAIQISSVIEYYSTSYNAQDDIKYMDFNKEFQC